MNKMKKILISLVMLIGILPASLSAKENEVTLYLFYGNGCSYCTIEKAFLADIEDDYDNLNIVMFETWDTTENDALVAKVREYFQITRESVPLTVIGEEYFIGFSDEIGIAILDVVDKYSQESHVDVVDSIIDGTIVGVKEDEDIVLNDDESSGVNIQLILAVVLSFVCGYYCPKKGVKVVK